MTGQRVILLLGGALLAFLVYAGASVIIWDYGRDAAPDMAPFTSSQHILGTDAEGRDWVRVLAAAGLADASVVLMSTTIGFSLAVVVGALGGAGLPAMQALLRSLSAVSILLIVLAGLAVAQVQNVLPNDPQLAAYVTTVLLGVAAAPAPAERFRQILIAERQTAHYRAAAELGVAPLPRFWRHALPSLWGELRPEIYRMAINLTVVILTLSFLSPGRGAVSLGDLIAREAGRFEADHWWHLVNPAAVIVLALLALCLLAEGRRR